MTRIRLSPHFSLFRPESAFPFFVGESDLFGKRDAGIAGKRHVRRIKRKKTGMLTV